MTNYNYWHKRGFLITEMDNLLRIRTEVAQSTGYIQKFIQDRVTIYHGALASAKQQGFTPKEFRQQYGKLILSLYQKQGFRSINKSSTMAIYRQYEKLSIDFPSDVGGTPLIFKKSHHSRAEINANLARKQQGQIETKRAYDKWAGW